MARRQTLGKKRKTRKRLNNKRRKTYRKMRRMRGGTLEKLKQILDEKNTALYAVTKAFTEAEQEYNDIGKRLDKQQNSLNAWTELQKLKDTKNTALQHYSHAFTEYHKEKKRLNPSNNTTENLEDLSPEDIHFNTYGPH